MKPVIYGLEGGLMNEGTVLNLTCEAHGGHPLAQLMWFRGVEKLKETRSMLSAETSRSVVTVILDRSMNSQEIRCEALNGALDEPLVTAKTVKVLFSPRRVIVRLEETSRRHVISGEPTRAFCSTSSSNPAAEILWQFSHKGAPVIARGASLYNRTSREFGGFEVENVISFTPTEDMDGSELRCVASHPLWSNSKAEVLPLRVMYPPRLVIGGPISIVVGEGDSFRENLTVKANPPVASWRWKKDGMPFDHSVGNVIVRGPLIMGRVVKGSDGGTYTLVAINSIGSANVSIHVTVEYPARVVFVTSPIIAAVGEEVVLECEAEGVPITNGMVRWLRGDTPLESVTYESPTRALLHLNASHETSGAYICTAFNNIGKANRTVAYLLVKKAPTIVRDATLMRSAGTLGSNARLKCRANAVPDVAFYWTISGASGPLRYNNSKYSFTIHQLDYSTYEGTLWISSLEQNDYQRPVKCLAMNSFGQDSTVIIVGPPSAPDPPFSLEVVNSSESSIQLSWSPGFDGGFEQIFEIRYQMSGDSVYRTMNTSDSTIEIRGLQSARRYEIAVRAINARGWVSDFSRPSIFVYTKDIDGEDVTAAEQKEAMPKHLLAAIAFGGTLLLVINIYLLCFMHRRQKRRKMQEKTEMVRKMPNGGGETVRPVQMYGAITTAENQYRPESVNTNRSDLGHDLISEDDQSVRTMIEVNPNGYIQQIDPNVFYDRDCLIEYEFDPTLYAEMRNGTLRRAPPTYSHMPYPEPPSDEVSVGAPSLTYSDTGTVPRSRDHCNTMDSPRRLHIPRIINEHTNSSSSIAGTFSAPNHNNNLGGISGSQMLSTFIQPGSGIRTTAFDYAQLDGDLV
ncbi:hypothetical protein AB6A40_003325 [Gnathostoma spinigerum]|uniref:Nephrin n=1 Tax=Gnathostoma spinigerum TaxID=75299 RepID=A0ABD6EGW5_9BILA